MTARVNLGQCRDCGVAHDGVNPVMDCPAILFEEILNEIEDAITNQPRSLQKRIGPSEIGEPCTRKLIHKLNGDQEPERAADAPDNWRAWVGTQMHKGLENIFQHSMLNNSQAGTRYLVEQRVNVGDINGVEITGSTDLVDAHACLVLDYKTKSRTQLLKARADVNTGRGPGQLYSVQAQLYGLGNKRAGRTVKRVMVIYIPRDGNLRDSFFWSEAYNETIAVDALNRATGLSQLIDAIGVKSALEVYPQLCDQDYCLWCKAERPPPQPFEPSQLPTPSELITQTRKATQ